MAEDEETLKMFKKFKEFLKLDMMKDEKKKEETQEVTGSEEHKEKDATADKSLVSAFWYACHKCDFKTPNLKEVQSHIQKCKHPSVGKFRFQFIFIIITFPF